MTQKGNKRGAYEIRNTKYALRSEFIEARWLRELQVMIQYSMFKIMI